MQNFICLCGLIVFYLCGCSNPPPPSSYGDCEVDVCKGVNIYSGYAKDKVRFVVFMPYTGTRTGGFGLTPEEWSWVCEWTVLRNGKGELIEDEKQRGKHELCYEVAPEQIGEMSFDGKLFDLKQGNVFVWNLYNGKILQLPVYTPPDLTYGEVERYGVKLYGLVPEIEKTLDIKETEQREETE